MCQLIQKNMKKRINVLVAILTVCLIISNFLPVFAADGADCTDGKPPGSGACPYCHDNMYMVTSTCNDPSKHSDVCYQGPGLCCITWQHECEIEQPIA